MCGSVASDVSMFVNDLQVLSNKHVAIDGTLNVCITECACVLVFACVCASTSCPYAS